MAQARSGSEIWLALQLTNFLHAQETRPRTPNHTRLPGTQPKFPHRQILHERNYRKHQRHWPIKLHNFLHTGPHFRLLADEIRRRRPSQEAFYSPPWLSLDEGFIFPSKVCHRLVVVDSSQVKMEQNSVWGARRQRHRSGRQYRRCWRGHLHRTARMGKEQSHVVIINAACCDFASLFQKTNYQSRIVANIDTLFLYVCWGLVRWRSCSLSCNRFGHQAHVDGSNPAIS